MKRAMVKLWPRAEAGDFEPLLQIHDELVFQTKNPDVVPELAAAMVAERGGVELKTEWSVGPDWSSLK